MVKCRFTSLRHAGVNGCDGETEFAGSLSKRSAGRMVRVEALVAADVLLVPWALPAAAETVGNDRPPAKRFTPSEVK